MVHVSGVECTSKEHSVGFFLSFVTQVNMNNFSDRTITFHNFKEHLDTKQK